MMGIEKTKKNLLKMALLIVIIGCCTGCSKKIELTSCDASFKEENGNWYNHSINGGWSAQCGNINYFFSGELTEEEIYNYIKETDKVIQQMEKTIGSSSKNYCIYVCDEKYNARVEENILYTSYLDFKNIEYITGIANLLLGNNVNYGLVYGFAVDVSRELGYEVLEGDIEEAIQLYDIEPIYFDLNYACFSPYYVEEDMIQQLKVIADYYYRFLKENNQTDVLKEYSPEKQRTYLNQFLAEYDKVPYENTDLDFVSVYSGGNLLRFIWENPDAKYHIETDFDAKEYDESTLYADNMINNDYKSLRELMVGYESQTNWINEKLSIYDVEHKQANVRFTIHDDYYSLAGGAYWPDTKEIHVFTLTSLEHEYIHFVVDEVAAGGWLEECICNYYSTYPGFYDISFAMQEENESYILTREADNEEGLFTREAIEQLGHEIDWNESQDIKYLNEMWTVNNDSFNKLMDKDMGIAPKTAFTYFLAEQYGEEAVITAMIYDTPEENLGTDWKSLMEKWKETVKDEFVWKYEN